MLAYTIAPTKSAYNWQALLEEIKERGVEDALLFISDGLKGMADVVFSVFPKAEISSVSVHVGRNIAHKVRVEDCQGICEDFKTIHQAKDAETAEKALGLFCEKWGKSYKKITQGLLDTPYIINVLSVSKSDLAKHLLHKCN